MLNQSCHLNNSSEENQESRSDANGKCIGAKLVTSTLVTSAFGLTNNGIASAFPLN